MNLFESLESRRLFAGTVVDSFGTANSGTEVVQINNHSYTSAASDSTVDRLGRLVLAGIYPGRHEISLKRLDAQGKPDFSFGASSGVATLPLAASISNSNYRPFQIATDGGGHVLILVGKTLTRLTNRGRIDTTFGTNGTVNLPVIDSATDLTADSKNRPVIVGTSQGVTGTRATIVRLNIDGAIDRTFGSNGAYKTPVPADASYRQPGDATGAAVQVLPDGRLEGAAEIRYRYSADQAAFYNGVESFRLSADGVLDSKFGSAGFAQVGRREDDVTNANSDFDAFLPDGGMIALNNISSKDSSTFQGGVNWSFIDSAGKLSKDGFSLVPAGLMSPPSRFVIQIAGVQQDGKLVISSDTSVYRLKTNFRLDTTFSPTATPAKQAALANGLGDILLIEPYRRQGTLIGSTFAVTEVLA